MLPGFPHPGWLRDLALCALLGLAAGPVSACSQCMCGMPFPPDALGGPVPQALWLGLEDHYLSKENGLEDADGLELEQEHRS